MNQQALGEATSASTEATGRPWLRHYPASVPHSIRYESIPLYELLARTADAWPQRTALVFFGKTMSYGELLHRVRLAAGGLKRLGLAKGDRAAIILPNCPQAVVAYYAALWAGGTVVMVNPLYTADEVRQQLVDSGARFVVSLDQLHDRVLDAARDTGVERILVTGIQEALPFPLNVLYPLKLRREGHAVHVRYDDRTVCFSSLSDDGAPAAPAAIDPHRDVALLQYTGGTTGTPKGVMLTHSNLVANCQQIAPFYPTTPGRQVTVLGVLPIFHAYGMTTVMNYGIAEGARIVLIPRFEAKTVLKAIERHRPQLLPGVPAMYVAIANHRDVGHFDLRSIEWCISGAAPLPAEVKADFERLTGGRLVEGYGLSEASPVTHCNPLEGLQKIGSIGIPLPDTDCRIVDVSNGLDVAPGEPGELLVKGPQIMAGYWNRPDETASTLVDGWLHTGDIARMDDDGYFFVVDRKKEMYIVSGFNVYPREVEEVLYQHPAIKEAAVIGIPDPLRGETGKAFVVLKEGREVDAGEIVAWCKNKLAPYKVPHEVEFRTELPKSLIGKVLRRVLAEGERARQSQRAAA